MSETIVVFRKDRTGGRTASPCSRSCPATSSGIYCTAYQHVGQHCAADYHGCIAQSDPATPAEYRDLYEETGAAGIHPVRSQRATPEMHESRRRIAAEWRCEPIRKTAACNEGRRTMPTLADRLHPGRFPSMSGKMAAIVGYILGQEWS